MKKPLVVVIAIMTMLLAFATIAYATQPISIFLNGKLIEGDTPAQIINGRTMVPLRLISEAMGAKVEWDGVNQRVLIQKDEEQLPLLKLNGEQTTWPYWIEKGHLYLEYRNTLALLRENSPHPSYVFSYFKDSNALMIGSRYVDVSYIQKGEYRALSLDELKRIHIINYEFDEASHNLKLLPID